MAKGPAAIYTETWRTKQSRIGIKRAMQEGMRLRKNSQELVLGIFNGELRCSRAIALM